MTAAEWRRSIAARFVEADEQTEMVCASLIARTNALLIGSPGTAKTKLLDVVSSSIGSFRSFYACLSQDTTPESIWGPIKLSALQQDRYERNITDHAAEANVIVLDEVFRCNGVVLSGLLDPMQNRRFRNNGNIVQMPVVSWFGATNFLPDLHRGTWDALLDRWQLRLRVAPLTAAGFPGALRRSLEDPAFAQEFSAPIVSKDDLARWHLEADGLPINEDSEKVLCTIFERAQEAGLPLTPRTGFLIPRMARPFAYLDGCKAVKRQHIARVCGLTAWNDEDQRVAIGELVKTVLDEIPCAPEDAEEMVLNAISDVATALTPAAVDAIGARGSWVVMDRRFQDVAMIRKRDLAREEKICWFSSQFAAVERQMQIASIMASMQAAHVSLGDDVRLAIACKEAMERVMVAETRDIRKQIDAAQKRTHKGGVR